MNEIVLGVFGFLYWLGEMLRAVAANPVWALVFGAGISFFIWRSQTKLSHHLIALDEKRQLYRKYLSKVEAARGISKSNETRWQDDPRMLELDGAHYELRLISGKAVSTSADELIIAVRERYMSEEQWATSPDGKRRDHSGNISHSVHQLIYAMRKELKIK